MKQYNRIMLGEGGKFIKDCLENGYIGVNFLKDVDLSTVPHDDEQQWRKDLIEKFLSANPDKSIGTARNSVGFLWTVSFGLKNGDIILAPNGEGGYCVAEITGSYHYASGQPLPHRRAVKWMDVVISRRDMSQNLQNSTGSIGTCCNITKYAEELEALISNGKPANTATVDAKPEAYKERSLHRLLSNYLLGKNILSKTIFHESSNRSVQAQKWVHPDMVGVEYNEFQESATRSLLKAAETKEYMVHPTFRVMRQSCRA